MDGLSNHSISEPARVKIIGVGTAGSNIVEQMLQTDLAELSLGLIHTHARVLQQHSVPHRLLIGVNRSHGLGTGGDAEVARAMAETDYSQITELVAGNELIFIVAGLGGGTGTGAAPVVAKAAKEAGALVIAIVATPFDFEGDRRNKQAQFGLQNLRSAADALICLPNQKLYQMLQGAPTILEAFAGTNALLVQGIRGIWQMLTRPGLINVDFAYLCSSLRGRHTESLLARAEAAGPNRASQLIERLLSNPVLEGGAALAEVDQVLVSLMGAQSLSIAEITTIMERLKRETDAELVFGTAIDPTSIDQVALTLIASKYGKSPGQPVIDAGTHAIRHTTDTISSSDSALVENETAPRPAPRFIAPPPESTPQKARELLQKQPVSRLRRGASKWKQEMLALEIVSRGRFEKSEPTIHRGADLDVPTYIRKNTPLN
jgi:cell division protein FtsZ